MIENNPHTFVKTATLAVQMNVEEGSRLKKPEVLPEVYNLSTGCFVSLHNADGSLRGCIGTIEPRFDNLYDEIVENAISASSQDPRFSPVGESELEQLHISVDVLTQPEETTIDQLDPSVYGLIITDGFRKGVLLPALETVDTVQKQIDIVKRKAGLSMAPNENLRFFRFSSKRYK